MSYDTSSEIERMIRAAGRCPQLTSGLRERILVNSMRTRASVERRLWWDHTLACCGVLVWLAILVRQQALFQFDVPGRSDLRQRLVAVAELTKKSISPNHNSSVTASAPVNRQPEWNQVKAVTRLRALQVRMLRRCFKG